MFSKWALFVLLPLSYAFRHSFVGHPAGRMATGDFSRKEPWRPSDQLELRTLDIAKGTHLLSTMEEWASGRKVCLRATGMVTMEENGKEETVTSSGAVSKAPEEGVRPHEEDSEDGTQDIHVDQPSGPTDPSTHSTETHEETVESQDGTASIHASSQLPSSEETQASQDDVTAPQPASPETTTCTQENEESSSKNGDQNERTEGEDAPSDDSTSVACKRCVCVDEFGIEIPPYHSNREKVKQQVMHYGPQIPEPLWKKPSRPIGFFGPKRSAPDVKFIDRDRYMVGRMMRRKYLNIIYSRVRSTYKRYIKNARNTNELLYWKAKLDGLPKDSSKTRFKNICMVTGRTRAVYRIVGLTRHKFREFVNKGFIPGVIQASW